MEKAEQYDFFFLLPDRVVKAVWIGIKKDDAHGIIAKLVGVRMQCHILNDL